MTHPKLKNREKKCKIILDKEANDILVGWLKKKGYKSLSKLLKIANK